MSKNWGYARKSTSEQHIERQIIALKTACPHLQEDDILIDAKSGKNFDRQEYQILKRLVRPGDILWIKDTERLGRNKKQVKEELAWLVSHGIRVKILSIPTTLIEMDGQDWIMELINTLLIEVFTSLDEQDYHARREKQAKGITEAKKRGVYKGRKPCPLPNNFEDIYQRWKNGELLATESMKLVNMKPSTFYRKIKSYEICNAIIVQE